MYRRIVDSEVVVRSDNRTIQIHRKSKQNPKLHRQMSENQGKLSRGITLIRFSGPLIPSIPGKESGK